MPPCVTVRHFVSRDDCALTFSLSCPDASSTYRIEHDCRHSQRLYDVFISLEKEIEDALPQFQELLLTLK